MAICRISKFSDDRLKDLVDKYGQAEGLKTYLNEKVTGEPAIDELVSPESIPEDKVVNHLKGLLRIKNNRLNNVNSNLKAAQREKNQELYKSFLLKKHNLHEDITKLEESISNLKQERDLNTLMGIANQQLDWVKSIFSKESISPSEITESGHILEMWSEIKNILYGENAIIDEKYAVQFNTLKARIDGDDMFGNWFRVMANEESRQAGYSTPSKFLEEMYKIKDLDKTSATWRYIGATGIKFLTALDSSNRDANIRIQHEFERWNEIMENIFAPVIKKNKMGLFWQKDSEGKDTGEATNPYSQNWYDADGESYGTFRKSLDKATSKQAVRNAYKKRNKFLKENTVNVDIRYLIDNTYTSSEGITKQMYIDTLKKEFGEAKTNEMVSKALNNYNNYLEYLEVEKKVIEGEKITKEEGDAKLNEWVSKNSPLIWLNQTDPLTKGEVREYTQNRSNRFILTSPKRLNIDGNRTEWYDKNYEEIESDPELLEAYNTSKEFMEEMLSYLPTYITSKIQSNFLPRVKADMGFALSGEYMKGLVSGYGSDFMDSITSSANLENRFLEENEVGKMFKVIPVKYTNHIPVDERNKDLPKIFATFAKTALNFKYKSQVQDKVELANKFLDVISKSKNRKEFTSDELVNMKKSLEWFGDSQLYEKTKLDEGTSNKKFFRGNSYRVINPSKEIEERWNDLISNNDKETAILKLKQEFPRDIEIISNKERYKELEKLRDEIEDKFYNKEITEEQYNVAIKPLEEEANAMGRNLVWSKVLDKLMRHNQALVFWFNPFSAFNNLNFGVVTNAMWAAGNTDFTLNESFKAFGLMTKSVFNLKDGKLDKNTNLIAQFNILFENLEYGSSDTENQTLKKLKAMPYAMLRKGDLFIKGQTLVAMMLHKQVEVVEDGVKKTISLYDAFGEDGKWNSEKYGENKDWQGDFAKEGDNKEFIKFKNYSDEIITKLHGNFNPSTTPAAKKYVLNRMLGQFRASWLVEGFAQRFEERKDSPYLGRDVEGRYRTMARIGFTKSAQSLARIITGYFTGNVNLNNLPAKDRALVEENLRKNLMEMYLYAAMFSLYLLLKAGLGDDDDDDDKLRLSMNNLNRVIQDTTFYLSPSTFVQIIKDPIPILSLPITFMRGCNGAMDLTFNDELTDREKAQKWRHITSNFYFINQYNKLFNMQAKVNNGTMFQGN